MRRPPAPSGAGDLESIAFADAGYYLLQYGGRQSRDRVSVVFDCGELGFGSLAAHGHADALSVAVRAFGVDVLVDPGTYDYFSFPEWRRYLRGTSAHNTIVVDGADQSAPLGSFLWGRRAEARCLEWAPRPGGGRVGGTHDGYLTLADPVECRRTLELDRASSSLVISDAIQATAEHDIALRFHLSERCEARAEGHRVAIDLGVGRAVLVLDDRLSIAMSRGSAGPDGGWVSRGYHRKAPAWTVTARLRHAGPLALRTVLQLQT